jgi:HAD superfamily hydrolase (TIGR01509 family)
LDTEQVCLETFLLTGDDLGLLDEAQLRDIFFQMVGLRASDSNKVLDRTIAPLMDRVKFAAAWDRAIDARLAQNVPVKAGATTMLAALHGAGIPVGVATSTQTARAAHHLEQAGLAQYLTTIVGGDQVKTGKPDPESYLKLAAALNVEPAHCAAFEDSDTGTLAAVRSGAHVVQVPDLKQPSDATRALGHHIAPNLISGARHLGLPVG